MRAMKFDTDGTAAVVTVPRPEPGPKEVIVQVLSTGACGSDFAALKGKHPFRFPPLISGHEAGGVISAVGSDVSEIDVGDRVVIEPQRPCRNCNHCNAGNYHVCESKQMLGITEWDGSFADYVKVPDYTIVPVPESIPDHALALVEPLAVAAHAVRQAALAESHGEQFHHLVLGGGPIGALITAVLSYQCPGKIVVSEPREQNARVLRRLGATDVRDPNQERSSDEPFDSAFVAVGVPDLVSEAIDQCVSGGTVVQVAVFNTDVAVPVGQLQVREISLVGTAMYNRQDFITAAQLLADRPEIADAVITDRVSLEEGAEAITRITAEGPGETIKLIMEPGTQSA
ncbi:MULTISPECIES: alcohol dehydrogenase catalytic domain-containing protein [unclassified Actinopolyspora]|uniref:zinc-dependent alcohol dehydrogenase n=1 Tax=unclassified Actinopolyspora TaxID=2639451 RepID=UPI0013F5F836|nr:MULTISPECIES: alcohol dehydrogenase catalytic domain-containing protein [unclassified Actinopolyspora]NHD19389.1 alcohol dehydrogenase catalytic domain-containing protein [Actinopolyspora sp. BKK2]NHE78538.1 alcohol dehydrogenase catalytic domain-containing protein [Actinopolyspora sp. BKK1]